MQNVGPIILTVSVCRFTLFHLQKKKKNTIVAIFSFYDWCESVSERAQHQDTFLVRSSLGNKVVLYCTEWRDLGCSLFGVLLVICEDFSPSFVRR